MKRLAIALLLAASTAFGFPAHSNQFTGAAANSVGPNFDAFLWSFSGFDDQVLIADISDIAFTNAGFRLSYPMRGKIYLDLVGSGITTFQTSIVTEVFDVFTQCYSAISYTNYQPAVSNQTLTVYKYVDFYTNLTINPITALVVNSYTAYAATKGTSLVAACNVYTGTAPTTVLASYGTYTNTWLAGSNVFTAVTQTLFLATYSSNMIADGNFVYAHTPSNEWILGGANGIAFTNAARQILQVNPTSAPGSVVSASQTPVFNPFVAGRVYQIKYSTSVTNAAGAGGSATVFSNDFCGTWKTNQGQGDFTYLATAAAPGAITFNWFNTGAVAIAYLDNVVIREYINDSTNVTTSVTTNLIATSNATITAYASSTRSNTRYVYTSNRYQRIYATLDRTQIPPNGLYYAEFLSWGSNASTSPARTVAKGQVTVEHSLYGNTNSASWTNPAINTVIGPPVHTLTPVAGWPFALSGEGPTNSTRLNGISGAAQLVGRSNIAATTSGTNIYLDVPLVGDAESATSFVRRTGSTMTGNLDMSDASITNVGHVESSTATFGQLLDASGNDAIEFLTPGLSIRSPVTFYDTATNTFVEIAATGVKIGTNSLTIDAQGNITQSVDLVSQLGTLQLSGTTNRLTDNGTNLLRNGTLISGSGSGSGFPLTNNANAIYSITNANDLIATNLVRGKNVTATSTLTGSALDINGSGDIQSDLVIHGNLTVYSNQNINNTINIVTTYVATVYITNSIDLYVTNNVYNTTNLVNSVTNTTNNVTTYTTNFIQNTTNYVTNIVTYTTNFVDTITQIGGFVDYSNSTYVVLPHFTDTKAGSLVANGSWDFTGASVSGLSVGGVGTITNLRSGSSQLLITNGAGPEVSFGLQEADTLGTVVARGSNAAGYILSVRGIKFDDGSVQTNGGISGQTTVSNLPSGTIFGIDGQNGAATLSRSASIPLIFGGATSVITQITGWTGQLTIASVELFSTSATAFSRSAKLRVRNSANTASRWNGVQYPPVPLVVYGTTIATTTGVGTNGFECTSYTPYDFLFGDSVELVSSGTVTRSVIYSSVTGGVFNVYETFPNYGAEAIVRAIRIYQPGAVYGTNPCLHLELSGAPYTGTVDSVVNFGIQ